MKYPLIPLFCLMLLAACGPMPHQLAATATWQVYDHEVATIIAETQVVRKQTETVLAPTETPPGPLPLSQVLLTGPEIEDLLALGQIIVDQSFEEENFYREFDLCLYECNARAWQNRDTGAFLLILLGRYSNADEATAYFTQNVDVLSKTLAPADIPFWDSLSIPEDARITDVGASSIVAAHYGPYVVLVRITLPQLDHEQQISFLGLYADKQLQKLVELGY